MSNHHGWRLSCVEAVDNARFITNEKERKPDNAVPRRPRIKVVEGSVVITTRRNMAPRPKREFPMLASTAKAQQRRKGRGL